MQYKDNISLQSLYLSNWSLRSTRGRLQVSVFWPYQDTKEKNEVKLKIQDHLIKHIQTGLLDHADCRASILTVAKGQQVWILLWKLSDAALDCKLYLMCKRFLFLLFL